MTIENESDREVGQAQGHGGNRTSFWTTKYFPELDTFRAVSVLLVLGMHCRVIVPLRRYTSGHLGLDIFFVLSGFLITTLLLREQDANGAISLKAFYIRRGFRILPVYFLALFAYFVLTHLFALPDIRDRFMHGLPYDLTLRNEYVPVAADVAFGHSWSLSVEEKFYLIWPILYFILLPRLRALWLALALPVILYFVMPNPRLFMAYFAILCGCAIAVLLHYGKDRQHTFVAAIRKVRPELPLILVIVTYLLVTRSYPTGTLLQIPRGRILFDIVFAAFLPFLLLTRSWFSPLFRSKALAFIGKRTYAMYLFHAIVLNVVENHIIHSKSTLSFVSIVLLAYALVFGVACVIYTTFEMPLIRIGHRVSGRAASRS
jgi:peptidoglycan/LPS O-acetylase OafA/YrhL